MRYLFMAFGLLLSFLSTAQEDIGYKKYSYSELFQMIEDEEDTLFVLRDAIIEFNLKTDLRHSIYAETSGVPDLWEPVDSIHINKALEFYNVQFIVNEGDSINGKAVFTKSGFHRVNFQKQVTFENTFSVLFNACTFQSEAYFTTSLRKVSGGNPADSLYKKTNDLRDRLIHGWFLHTNSEIAVQNSVLKKGILIRSGVNGVSINLKGNEIEAISNMLYGKQPTELNINGGAMELVDNHFTDIVSIDSDSSYSHTFQNNHFRENVSLRIYNNRSLYFGENRFEGYVLMNIDRVEELKTNWQQFYKKTIPYLYFREDGKFFTNMTGPIDIMPLIYGNDNIENFIDSTRISSPQVFLSEQERYSELYEHFKKTHNTQSANLIYLEIKDLETERLVYEYTQNPSFDLYFTIKINQFLKLFSDYGTRPSKAITFSIYVILAFALIYLFFPNHWDSHGKNRIMDRYRFFLKYVNKDSGIHEVYLDEKKPALLASEDFKLYLEEQGKTAPKFFMATALPLYRWSVAGTRTFSWLLSKVDVLKGTWSSTEDSKKAGKSVLIIGAFLIAIVYDLFIKMLNALMLSINTFTTLGFGEIPIKGLPRYLAIIQGFIGWFMLTIFSVSLISQLLN